MTDEQFDGLIHFIEYRIAVALEKPSPARHAMTKKHLVGMKSKLRSLLVDTEKD